MDREALLGAIVATPHEDMPRLAYADWLDENSTEPNGAATAEFIRVSCPPRSGSRSNNLMPGKAYRWLDENWKRLVPGVLALETVMIGGVAYVVFEADRGPFWTRNGRTVGLRLSLTAPVNPLWRRREQKKYTCSVGLTFFKGFCTELSMWSPWAERIVRPVLAKEAPLLDKFKPRPAPVPEDL